MKRIDATKYDPKSISNQSEIHEKCVRNLKKFDLGAFWDRSGRGLVPGALVSHRRVTQNRNFERKRRPKGRFWAPPKTQNGSKIDHWRQDWHQDPLKMLSGRGSEKTLKINEKKHAK